MPVKVRLVVVPQFDFVDRVLHRFDRSDFESIDLSCSKRIRTVFGVAQEHIFGVLLLVVEDLQIDIGVFVVVARLTSRGFRSHDVFTLVWIVSVMLTIFTLFARFIRSETGQSDVRLLIAVVQIEPTIDREAKEQRRTDA